MPEFAIGQRWTYKGDGHGADSTVLIGRIDSRPSESSIIHLMVENLDSPTSTETLTIGHMPFSDSAVTASVIELVDSNVEIGAGFDEGFAEWKRQSGGVFEISITEALHTIIRVTAESPQHDQFDDLVLEMREQRTQEVVDVLYRKLFSLPRWFFICDPHDGRSPVQWSFPDSPNRNPAVLAFTSRERATAAATELDIYAVGDEATIMAPSVEEAVQWITGPGFVNEWLNFNLTQESFPFYVDGLQARFEALAP